MKKSIQTIIVSAHVLGKLKMSAGLGYHTIVQKHIYMNM